MKINAALALGGPQTWLNNSGSALTVPGNITNGGYTLTVAGSGNTAISGSMTGAGGLTKAGPGLLTLTGSNTYGGNTTVNQGTLEVDFSAAGCRPTALSATTRR